MKNVLFICHGNICRSPMAEFVLKDMAKKAGIKNVSINSLAATNDEKGNDTYYATKEVLDEKNIPYTKRQSRKMALDDYNNADILIVMDENNVNQVKKITNGDPDKKIRKLMSFVGEDKNVADPWFTRDFESTYNDIERACKEILKIL